MLDLKLHINTIEDEEYIISLQKRYSYAKKHLYKHFHTISEKDIESYVMNMFSMNTIEARSVINEVSNIFKRNQTEKTKLELRHLEIDELINDLNSIENKTKKDRREINNLYKKKSLLNKSLSSDVVFGSKNILQKISYLSNTNDTSKLNEYKTKYQENRLDNIYLLGEANLHGNRFFNFDLLNNTIYYKPNRNIKIKIVFSDKRKQILSKLQELIDSKSIAITIKLSTKYIHLTFDDSIVSGYKLDQKSRRKEVQEITKNHIDKETKDILIKNVYKKYYKELEIKMLKGKVNNRYLAVDSNPNYLGFVILDKINDTDFKVVKTFYYDLSKLNNKKVKNSNKRIHGISHIWKDVFQTINYYKVAYLITEKLEFSIEEIKQNKEFNRQTKNVWYRELSNNLINKYCNKQGIQQIEINAVYSSTIGNLCYNYVDCINASIEIGRRGIFKFTKGTFYPDINKTDFHTMSRINKDSRDVEMLKDCSNWKELHTLLKKSGLRYRKSLKDLNLINISKNYIKSSKLSHSKIKKIIFI